MKQLNWFYLYRRDLYFSATITATFPTGATCTCVGDSESYTASSSPTTFTVHSAGTYTITATDGVATDTETVVITTNGQSESVSLSFIPEGSTVLPVNDVQILLHCADIWDKSYTTIAALISDTTSLSRVIASNNAIDYLVRSTSFASSMCANQTAMTYIGANNYAANTLLANTTWRTPICNSSYFEKVLNVKIPVMTSATTPSGSVSATAYESDYYPYHAFDFSTNEAWIPVWHPNDYGAQWITYAFPGVKKIYKYTMAMYTEYANGLDSAVLQGSTNNSSFSNLVNVSGKWSTKTGIISGNITGYRYYRLYIGKNNSSKSYRIYYIQLYGRQNV